jgi:hypothetical protein
MMADGFCHITFPVSKWSFDLRHRLAWKKQMPSFLTQFFSHGSLRGLQERRRFCHITFLESGKNGRLQEPGALQMSPVAATKSYVAEYAGFTGSASCYSEKL